MRVSNSYPARLLSVTSSPFTTYRQKILLLSSSCGKGKKNGAIVKVKIRFLNFVCFNDLCPLFICNSERVLL